MDRFGQFVKQHLGAAIAAVTAAAVIAGGILLILTVGGGGSTTASSGGTTTVTTVAPGGRRGAATGPRRLGVRGKITAVDGDTWTVQSAKGASVTVVVTPGTTFGTKADPLSASAFSVGQRVVVLGPRSGSTVTATRIAMAPAGTGGKST